VDEKQNGACCNPDGGEPEEDVVGKQDGAVSIGSRRCRRSANCGLVEENGGNPPVS